MLPYHAALKVHTDSNVGYGLLLQDMAQLSEYFCEKANDGGLVAVFLVTVDSYLDMPVHEVSSISKSLMPPTFT